MGAFSLIDDPICRCFASRAGRGPLTARARSGPISILRSQARRTAHAVKKIH